MVSPQTGCLFLIQFSLSGKCYYHITRFFQCQSQNANLSSEKYSEYLRHQMVFSPDLYVHHQPDLLPARLKYHSLCKSLYALPLS